MLQIDPDAGPTLVRLQAHSLYEVAQLIGAKTGVAILRLATVNFHCECGKCDWKEGSTDVSLLCDPDDLVEADAPVRADKAISVWIRPAAPGRPHRVVYGRAVVMRLDQATKRFYSIQADDVAVLQDVLTPMRWWVEVPKDEPTLTVACVGDA